MTGMVWVDDWAMICHSSKCCICKQIRNSPHFRLFYRRNTTTRFMTWQFEGLALATVMRSDACPKKWNTNPLWAWSMENVTAPITRREITVNTAWTITTMFPGNQLLGKRRMNAKVIWYSPILYYLKTLLNVKKHYFFQSVIAMIMLRVATSISMSMLPREMSVVECVTIAPIIPTVSIANTAKRVSSKFLN